MRREVKGQVAVRRSGARVRFQPGGKRELAFSTTPRPRAPAPVRAFARSPTEPHHPTTRAAVIPRLSVCGEFQPALWSQGFCSVGTLQVRAAERGRLRLGAVFGALAIAGERDGGRDAASRAAARVGAGGAARARGAFSQVLARRGAAQRHAGRLRRGRLDRISPHAICGEGGRGTASAGRHPVSVVSLERHTHLPLRHHRSGRPADRCAAQGGRLHRPAPGGGARAGDAHRRTHRRGCSPRGCR